MVRLIPMFVVLAIISAAHGADAVPLKALNDVWTPDSAQFGGVLTTAEGADKGEFQVDATADPKTMDIEGKDGPNKGKKFPCIYKLNGDELTICYDLSGKARPAEFLVVYHRQK